MPTHPMQGLGCCPKEFLEQGCVQLAMAHWLIYERLAPLRRIGDRASTGGLDRGVLTMYAGTRCDDDEGPSTTS